MCLINSLTPARNLVSTVWAELCSQELQCDLLNTTLSKVYWVGRATSNDDDDDDVCLCPALPIFSTISIFANLVVKSSKP